MCAQTTMHVNILVFLHHKPSVQHSKNKQSIFFLLWNSSMLQFSVFVLKSWIKIGKSVAKNFSLFSGFPRKFGSSYRFLREKKFTNFKEISEGNCFFFFSKTCFKLFCFSLNFSSTSVCVCTCICDPKNMLKN